MNNTNGERERPGVRRALLVLVRVVVCVRLWGNRVLKDTSLNERQKNKIAEMVSKAQSVEEAKLIFETLHKTVAGTKRNNSPESLSEAVTRRSSVILSGRRSTTDTETSSPVLNRWATLAGLENKD